MNRIAAMLKRFFTHDARSLDPAYIEQQRLFREAEERQRRLESLMFWQMQSEILKSGKEHDRHGDHH